MKAEVKNGFIYISFKYDPDLVSKVRGLTGRRYNPQTKIWIVPDIPEHREQLISWGFSVKYSEQKNQEIKITVPSNTFDFQKKAIKAMVKHRRILLADEMGLGKTMQAILATKNLKAYPCLVVCPASLKYTWANEIMKWDSGSFFIFSGNNNRYFTKADFYIINYDILAGNLELLFQIPLKCIILDESHYIKNSGAKRTKVVKRLVKHAKLKAFYALTGTPILNRPIEIFNTLNLLKPEIFKSRWNFAKQFCDLKYNGFGWDFNGASNTEKLNKLLLATVMIRRKKEDVLNELPDKVRTVIPIELTNYQEYRFAEDDFVSWLQNKGSNIPVGAETLVKIEKLKQLSADGKMKAIKEWINNFLETGKKLVVFGHHKKVISYLSNMYKGKCVVIDGSTPKEKREENVRKFQENPKIKLIIGNIKAMGVGLTLTAASDLLFVELGWTPGEHDQAEDRIHRIGQKGTANIYYAIGKDTIEEKILEVIDQKRKVINKVIDGEKIKFDTLTELLKKMKGKKNE